MKVVQILPELNSGGVERGTLEVAQHLVENGHEALVISNGGRLVPKLEALGARHVSLPVHKKSPFSLMQVRPLRRLLETERVDILHARSRVPAWLSWFALNGMDVATRPRFVTTVHGAYSVSPYSAIMTRGERVIAISKFIESYIRKNYPAVPAECIRVIYRGVSPEEFPRGFQPDAKWLREWEASMPRLKGVKILTLPGRITRWKGHEDFIGLLRELRSRNIEVHGLIAGDTHPRKRRYGDEMRRLVSAAGLDDAVSFLGHRSDVREIMAVSDVVYSLSTDPEPFGRVSLEAMALGRPVVAYDHGGVGEQLRELHPAGLVPPGDAAALVNATLRALEADRPLPSEIKPPFTRGAMCAATSAVYEELSGKERSPD